MNDKAKLGLSIVAIVLCGGFIVNYVSLSGTSADFPDGGTWTLCNACGEMQVIDDETRGRFYDDTPSHMASQWFALSVKKAAWWTARSVP